MSEIIIWELYYIRNCFLWGIFLALIYDLIRIIRIMFPHGVIVMAVEDFLYWLTAAMGMFAILYKEDDGKVRWFAIAAALTAMLLVNRFVSRYTVPKIGNFLAKPLRFLTKTVRKLVDKLKKTTYKCLKSIWKQFTIREEKKLQKSLQKSLQKAQKKQLKNSSSK